MNTPVVSVVMAAYNGAAFLPATLDSLARQTLSDWEAIVVDDCSTDDTLAVLRAWPDARVRVIAAEANRGPVHTRNHALEHARGRYIAGLDQDDLCRPERFARQVAFLEQHPDVVALGTSATLLTDGVERPDTRVPQTTPALVGWLLLLGNPLIWSSMMIRGDIARCLTPFTDPDLLYAEDFDLYQRLSAIGPIARLDEPLLVYRMHAGGASQRFTDIMRANAARVLRRRYDPLLGKDAGVGTALVERHVMQGEPVPDRATLARLGGVLSHLLASYVGTALPDRASLELIWWETARLWGRIGRRALRSGHLTIRDVMAVRPDHMGLGYAGADTLLSSRLIGGARAIRRRTG